MLQYAAHWFYLLNSNPHLSCYRDAKAKVARFNKRLPVFF